MTEHPVQPLQRPPEDGGGVEGGLVLVEVGKGEVGAGALGASHTLPTRVNPSSH